MIYFFGNVSSNVFAVESKGKLKASSLDKLEWLFSGESLISRKVIKGIFIGGFSQGGMMSLHNNYNGMVEGLIILSSRLVISYFIDIISDTLLVFEGEGGKSGLATGPYPLKEGMNRFLSGVDVTFRRDHDSKRPRINKQSSRKDREQRAKGDFYSFDS